MERKLMKVSVIIPIFNQEKYLNRCVDSLISQDFDDYEIILVNDGSTDKTPQICDEYAEKYSFIKVIHKVNAGVSAARNSGIDSALGEYIMFVDSDDYVTENYISTMYNHQIENHDKMIVCNMYKKKEAQKDFVIAFNEYSKETLTYSKDEYFLLYKAWLSPYSCNKIFSKDLLVSNSVRFDPNYVIGEDVLFTVNYFSLCNGFVVVTAPLYYYCILDEGADSKYRKDIFYKSVHTFSSRIPLIKKEEDLTEFCDIYLYSFINTLKHTFDKRNTDSIFKKIKYNNSILGSKEFVFCLEHASKETESPKHIKLLKKGNYLWIYLREKAIKLFKR